MRGCPGKFIFIRIGGYAVMGRFLPFFTKSSNVVTLNFSTRSDCASHQMGRMGQVSPKTQTPLLETHSFTKSGRRLPQPLQEVKSLQVILPGIRRPRDRGEVLVINPRRIIARQFLPGKMAGFAVRGRSGWLLRVGWSKFCQVDHCTNCVVGLSSNLHGRNSLYKVLRVRFISIILDYF